jgi:hypothetical protein
LKKINYRNSQGLPRLPDPVAMHGQSIPLRIPSRERGRIGSNAGPHSAAARHSLDQRRETVEHGKSGNPLLLMLVKLMLAARPEILP